MTDKKKLLLNESTVRRFMALAGVQSLVDPFLEKVNEAGAAGLAEPTPASFEMTPEVPSLEEDAEVAAAAHEGTTELSEEKLEEGGPESCKDTGCTWDEKSKTCICPPITITPGKKKKGEKNECKKPRAPRTLAESILRRLPNLEIIDDKPTFKPTTQSDILEEVLRRVKQRLS